MRKEFSLFHCKWINGKNFQSNALTSNEYENWTKNRFIDRCYNNNNSKWFEHLNASAVHHEKRSWILWNRFHVAKDEKGKKKTITIAITRLNKRRIILNSYELCPSKHINITPFSKRKVLVLHIFMNERYVIYRQRQMSVMVSIFHHELFDAMPLELKFEIRNKSGNDGGWKENDFNRLKAKSRTEKIQLPIVDTHNIN